MVFVPISAAAHTSSVAGLLCVKWALAGTPRPRDQPTALSLWGGLFLTRRSSDFLTKCRDSGARGPERRSGTRNGASFLAVLGAS